MIARATADFKRALRIIGASFLGILNHNGPQADIVAEATMEYPSPPETIPTTKYTAGVLILFDIIASTTMKRKNPDTWRLKFEHFYTVAAKLKDSLAQTFTHASGCVLKNLGDGVLIFCPIEVDSPMKPQRFLSSEAAQTVFQSVLEFWYHLDSNFATLGIRVKTVITAVNDLHLIRSESRSQDALGRGVDFSFRLEKFGDSSHFVVNGTYLEALGDTLGKAGYLVGECEKLVKGWEVPQPFAIVTNPDWIVKTYDDRASDPSSDNVYLELFQLYLQAESQSESVDESALEAIKEVTRVV